MGYRLNRKEATRVVTRLLHCAAAGASIWTISIACAQVTHPRSLVTAAQVIAAMQDRHLPTNGVQVSLAAAITSAVARPSLQIQAIVPLNASNVRLRLTCRDRSACLPFFAVATYSQAIDPAVLGHDSEHPAVSAQAALTTAASIATAATPANASAVPVMRIGSPATLDFDEPRVHVRVDVICLESGVSGDRVRVTTRDRKQIYVAEIVSPGNLKGTLTR